MNKRFQDEMVPVKNAEARRDVAVQMKAARMSRSLTQQQLAELTGTKKSNISRMESGSYNPSLDFMVKIAEGLGKTLKVKVE